MDLGILGKVLGAVTSPLTGALDMVGDALGLPPLLTNSIKAAVGVATGNVLMVADGAVGIMSELTKNPPAQTEYTPPKDSAQTCAGYAQKTHSASPASNWTPAPQSTGSSGGVNGGIVPDSGILDPMTLDYRNALRQLSANFSLLEGTERGPFDSKDGKVSADVLSRAADNQKLPTGLRDACRFFKEHPDYRNMLDTAGKGGRTDGIISTLDVQAALTKVNSDIAQYGVKGQTQSLPPSSGWSSTQPSNAGGQWGSPATPSPSTSSPGSDVSSTGDTGAKIRDILNNPNMSLEEKIQAVLMALEENVDNEIESTMKQMAAAQDQSASLANTPENQKKIAESKRNAEMLNLRLQQLMEKRKSMFDLMSNISSKFNEMAKTAINNLRSA